KNKAVNNTVVKIFFMFKAPFQIYRFCLHQRLAVLDCCVIPRSRASGKGRRAPKKYIFYMRLPNLLIFLVV
ncbi:hypothetical protein, partial [Klebsiella pneumoniae]